MDKKISTKVPTVGTVRLDSTSVWETGFSANLKIESNTDFDYQGKWILTFETDLKSFNQWQIISTKNQNTMSINSGLDWEGKPHFPLGPHGSAQIDGISASGATFSKDIIKNVRLNGEIVDLFINGEVVDNGSGNSVTFPETLPIDGSISIEEITVSRDQSLLHGTVSITPMDILDKNYSIYLNNIKILTEPIPEYITPQSIQLSIDSEVLPLNQGPNNKIEIVFGEITENGAIYYVTNSVYMEYFEFPNSIPTESVTLVGTIALNTDKTKIEGIVTLPIDVPYYEYSVYVNNQLVKEVEFNPDKNQKAAISVSVNIADLPLIQGDNIVCFVFPNSNAWCITNSVNIHTEIPTVEDLELIGYWCSWGGNGPTSYIDLEAVPTEYKTIAVSFIENEADNITPKFNPTASGQVTDGDFIKKVANMRAKGHNITIAIGGQNGIFKLNTEQDKEIFKNGIIAIIERYGFNGFDIDLEGGSVQGATQTQITNMINAITEIVQYFRVDNPKFVYSLAPEVAYIISSGWGTMYIDIITATKNLITTLHPQYYNAPGTGVFPIHGNGTTMVDCSNQREFITEFTHALILGHDGPGWGQPIAQVFPIGPIPQQLLAIGLPAGEGAAGTGSFNDMAIISDAWSEIKNRGYKEIKGYMTWSIDWDEYHSWQFKNTVSSLNKN